MKATIEQTIAETELIPVNQNPIEVFQNGGLDPVLEAIKRVIAGFTPDVSTAKGRREIASMAHKVAKSKTHLDTMGKNLVADWKEKSKVVDAERKRIRDTLDKWKAEVRKPLDEWEARESKRIAELEAKVTSIDELWKFPANAQITSEQLKANLDQANALNITTEEYGEVHIDAQTAKDRAVMTLETMLVESEKRANEKAELERLRQEAAERAKRDEEERLRKEGEERARREAEAKAKEEQQAREEAEAKRKQEELRREEEHKAALARAQQEKIDAENRAKEAVAKAKRDAQEQTRKELEKHEAQRRAEEEARQKREADEKYRSTIVNQSVKCLVDSVGLSEKDARNVIRAIANREIKNVTISF